VIKCRLLNTQYNEDRYIELYIGDYSHDKPHTSIAVCTLIDDENSQNQAHFCLSGINQNSL